MWYTILTLAVIALVITSVKWYVSFTAMTYYAIKNGCVPTDEELRECTMKAIRHLVKK